ncbi:MAG: hypothetical protein ACM3MG_00060 [Bacillota bacterium]
MHLDESNFDSKATSLCSLHDLSVIDDQKIRTEVFSTTASLLKQIRKLEKDHADFMRWDQILYEDWYNLTFRKERLAVEQLERRYRTLTTFHIHLKHIAETSQVSLARAFTLLKEEEHQFQCGDDDWKFIIGKLRQQRLEAANKNKPTPEAPNSPEEPHTLLLATEVIENNDSGVSTMNRHERSIYYYLREIDDAMMTRHFEDASTGYKLFKESFQIAMKCTDWKLLFKIWKNSSQAYQQNLLKPMPHHLKDFLSQTIANVEAEYTSESEVLEKEIAFRSTYRKLARMLHPDTQNPAGPLDLQDWSLKMWQKVQTAYKAKDYNSLKRLELMCMAELGDLNSLTLDEIYQSSLIFAEELETLRKNLRSFRKHPAWRFSSRRGYDALTMRISRQFKKRLQPLEAEVKALEQILKEASEGDSI